MSKNDEINYIELLKILLREKITILLIIAVLFIISIVYNLNKADTFSASEKYTMAYHYSVDRQCQSNANLTTCIENKPKKIFLYSNDFLKELQEINKLYKESSVTFKLANNTLDLNYLSKNKNDLLELVATVEDKIKSSDQKLFEKIYNQNSSTLALLNQEIDFYENERISLINALNRNNEVIDETLKTIQNEMADASEKDKLSNESISLMKLKYELKQDKQSNDSEILSINNRLDNNYITNIKLLAKSYERAMVDNFYNSKINHDLKIKSFKENIERNLVLTFFIGLFLGILFALRKEATKKASS